MQPEAQRHCANPNRAFVITVWATEFSVWATENPVAQTLFVQTPPLHPAREGDFRPSSADFLTQLQRSSTVIIFAYHVVAF